LYVKSSDGSYVYVPTSDSVINATSTTVTDTFIIEATDSAGTKGNTLTITINGLNDTPTVANIIGNQTATQDSVYNFQFPSNVFSDVDSGDIQTYTAQLVDSNGNLINGGILPTWLTFTSGTRTFSGTPANADVGILNVKVTAIDGSNAMASNTFSLTIANVNDAPSGSVIISGIVKQGETLTASNTIADADGLGTITYQWYADNVLITGATNSTYILTQNEVDKIITVKASYTDGQNTNETVISSATTSIVNVNDAPTVSSENIDVTVPFGNDYVKNISTLFNDIDNSDTLIFEAINLPSGLSINPLTGVISGKPTQSGNFVITIKGTDSGSPALSVSRTYTMLVLAPAQMTVDTPTVNTPTESNTIPTEKNTNISLNTFTDNTNFGIFNYGTNGNNNVENIVEGFISNKNPQDNPPQNTTETPTPNNTPTDNGKGMIQSNVDLNVSANGQISFNQGNQDSFSIVGITIEDIKVENGNLEIKVVDTNLSQNFIVTQSDGTSLPTGLSFNPKTGTISGIIPDNLEKLEISIKAINPDGTTKVLNLKLDLKQLKQKTQAEAESFIGLKEQIALENQKNDGYGSYLTKLFA
jgi:trimeric autotransporter adhesin